MVDNLIYGGTPRSRNGGVGDNSAPTPTLIDTGKQPKVRNVACQSITLGHMCLNWSK